MDYRHQHLLKGRAADAAHDPLRSLKAILRGKQLTGEQRRHTDSRLLGRLGCWTRHGHDAGRTYGQR